MIETNSHLNKYSTKDIYLASILKLAGIQLLKVERSGNRGIFVFPASNRIDEIITKYFNNDLKVDPKTLFETWKSLKSMVFSAIDNVR